MARRFTKRGHVRVIRGKRVRRLFSPNTGPKLVNLLLRPMEMFRSALLAAKMDEQSMPSVCSGPAQASG